MAVRDRYFLILLGSVLVLSLVVVAFSGSLKREREEPKQDISSELEGVMFLREGDETGRATTYSGGGLFPGERGQIQTFELGGQPSGYAVLQVGRWREENLILLDSEGEEFLQVPVTASTNLWIENLLVSPFKDVRSNITVFSALGLQEKAAQELIDAGDILVVIYPVGGDLAPKDILALVLRRYGGLEQLQKETSITLSAPR